jgi:hypothetical protein
MAAFNFSCKAEVHGRSNLDHRIRDNVDFWRFGVHGTALLRLGGTLRNIPPARLSRFAFWYFRLSFLEKRVNVSGSPSVLAVDFERLW